MGCPVAPVRVTFAFTDDARIVGSLTGGPYLSRTPDDIPFGKGSSTDDTSLAILDESAAPTLVAQTLRRRLPLPLCKTTSP
ncbi:hypothetical protein Ciccas_013909 [Cichlidogyrus casuarinus]|uniref:Uncharacterized protein n=1 Tax=Cichlidogyrus casuarinus TaxID=1844966 RepID=A0ABD2PJF9_9PLAT